MQQATEEVVAAAAAADGAAAAAAGGNGKPRRLSRQELKRMQVGVPPCVVPELTQHVVMCSRNLITWRAMCTTLQLTWVSNAQQHACGCASDVLIVGNLVHPTTPPRSMESSTPRLLQRWWQQGAPEWPQNSWGMPRLKRCPHHSMLSHPCCANPAAQTLPASGESGAAGGGAAAVHWAITW